MRPLIFLVSLVSLIAVGVVACATPHIAASSTTPTLVSCPTDGQVGPLASPTVLPPMVSMTPTQAIALAYYASGVHIGVLAPRGLRCACWYGAAGAVLTLRTGGVDGPVVVAVNAMLTDTSGRFAAARLMARVFPARAAFVDAIAAEGREPKPVAGPFADDVLERIGDDVVHFRTPAGQVGLGSLADLLPGAAPTRGVAIATDEATLLLAYQLSEDVVDEDLVAVIAAQFELESLPPTP